MYELISVADHMIEPPGVSVDRLPAKCEDTASHVIDDGAREW